MSRAALAIAARDVLRLPTNQGGLALTKDQCGLAPDGGKPPPSAGELYVGVWAAGRTARQPNWGLSEDYVLTVTVTHRMSGRPYDRAGDEVIAKAVTGLEKWSDAVRVCLGGVRTNDVRNTANALIGENLADAAGVRGFTTNLMFEGDDEPRLVGGEWFQAQADEDVAGFAQRLRFGITRVQSREEGAIS